MTELESGPQRPSDRKILENPFVGSLVVPIAIVLVGALIIFGVTKMLSTERGYKDLVREMHSKTFGNRWIAAYELSKVISSSQIPKEELPWLIDNLSDVYTKSVDPRTKRFIVAAMGALQTELALPLLNKALLEPDNQIQFHAIAALGNMQSVSSFDWSALMTFLDSKDDALRQAALLALGSHRVAESEEKILQMMNDEKVVIRYSAATALIPFQNIQALPILREILFLNPKETTIFNAAQISGLKQNILHSVKKYGWKEMLPVIGDVAAREEDLQIAGLAREVLNLLKK